MESRGRSLVRTVTLGKRGRSYSASSRSQRMKIYRSPTSLSDNKIYRFSRTYAPLIYTMNESSGFGTTGQGLGFAYKLSGCTVSQNTGSSTVGLPNTAEFGVLFDQWRLDKVEVQFIFSLPVGVTNGASTEVPVLLVCEDNNDGDAVSAALGGDYVRQRKHRTIQCSGIQKVTIKPKCAVAAYQGAFTAYVETDREKLWVSTTYPDTQYYGMKIWWDRFRSGNTDIGTLQIVQKAYFSFRGVS